MDKQTQLQTLVDGYGPKFPPLEELLASRPDDEALQALGSPVPALGRYWKSVRFMGRITSGEAVGIKRFYVAKAYLFALARLMENYDGIHRDKKIIEGLSNSDIDAILRMGTTATEVWQAEQIEKFTDHDTAAATDYLKILAARQLPHFDPSIEAIHFALTSEDVMGNVFGMIGNQLVLGHFMEHLIDFCLDVLDYSAVYEAEQITVIPGITHRQPAEPTHPNKRPIVTVKAIVQLMQKLTDERYCFIPFPGKLGSALGNLLAQYAAYPDIDWWSFAEDYVKSMGLTYEPMTHQSSTYAMESHIFTTVANIITQLIKLVEDFIDSAAAPAQFFYKEKKAGEKGSSIMPGKAQAWGSEGGKKMFKKTRLLLMFLAEELADYPYEGDMGRSYLFRDIGTDFMPAFIALDRVGSEMKKYKPNSKKIASFFHEYPGMAGSALQTILKREKVEGDAYREIQKIAINPDGTYANHDQFGAAMEAKMEELRLLKPLREELRSLLDPSNLIKHLEKPLREEMDMLRWQLNQLHASAKSFLVPPEYK